jgi:hypothetical protein
MGDDCQKAQVPDAQIGLQGTELARNAMKRPRAGSLYREPPGFLQ